MVLKLYVGTYLHTCPKLANYCPFSHKTNLFFLQYTGKYNILLHLPTFFTCSCYRCLKMKKSRVMWWRNWNHEEIQSDHDMVLQQSNQRNHQGARTSNCNIIQISCVESSRNRQIQVNSECVMNKTTFLYPVCTSSEWFLKFIKIKLTCFK